MRRWIACDAGNINLLLRYGSNPLEFSKGKNAIELSSELQVSDTSATVRESAEHGKLDTLIEQQAQFVDE